MMHPDCPTSWPSLPCDPFSHKNFHFMLFIYWSVVKFLVASPLRENESVCACIHTETIN